MESFGTFVETLEQHRQSPNDRLVVPICVRKSADLLTPVSAYLLLRNGAEYAFLLESVEGGEACAVLISGP